MGEVMARASDTSMARRPTSNYFTKGENVMTKLGNDTAPESPSKGTDSDRLSMSPQSIRHGGADPTDIDSSPVQTNTGEFNYDTNTLPTGVEPGPWDASH
jgi:hypothetical protein